MATLEQLKEGIIRAHQAGNLEHAKILADAYKAQAAQETAPVEAPSEELPSRSIGDIGSDIVTGAAKGITSALQAGVGLADIPTGGEAGKALKPYLDLEKLQEEYSKHYSPQQQAAIKATEEAKGFGGTLEAYAQNPSAIVSSVGESIPSMLVGGGLGKGLQTIKALKGLATPVVAGALGEGLVGAGSAAESLREQAPDELLSGKGTVAALGAGIGTSLFGLAGGKLAQKFGVVDPDTLMTGGLKALKSESANAGEEVAKKSFLKDMIGSGISEGVFEEMPQSAQEKMWANFAMDRPLTEGVSEAMASGLVTGAAMGTGAGGGFNVFQGPQEAAPPVPPPSTEPPKEEVVPIMAPTVEAFTPQAQLIADVKDLKKKTAIVNDWIGTDRGKLFNEIMAQDFDTHEGLDKVEELLGGKESTLNKRGLSIAEKDLEKYRGAIDATKETRSSEEQVAAAPEVHPNIAAAQSALDAYTAKPSLPANIRAVNEAADTLGIGGDLANKVSSMQNIVAQAQPVAQPVAQPAVETPKMEIPHVDNNLGQPIHPTEEGVKNFWNWFGDSKVVDAEGKPLVVYHGTKANFNSFAGRPAWKALFKEDIGTSYFTTDKEMAKGYSGGSEPMPVYLNFKNPYIYDAKGASYIGANFDALVKAKKEGYDGAIIKNVNDTSAGQGDRLVDTFVAFEPNQIKSATGNQGTFNPEEADIREAEAYEAPIVSESVEPTDFTTGQTREEFGKKLGASIQPQTGRLKQAPSSKLESAMEWLKGQARMGTSNGRPVYRDISMDHALDALKDNPNPLIQQIADKAKNQLKDISFDFNTRLRKPILGRHSRYLTTGKETITLHGQHYWDAATLAHEIMHGFAALAIDNPTEAQKPTVEALRTLFNAVSSHPSLRGEYGLKDVHEFVSEGLSNPEFQYKLSKIKYENTTAWGKFTQFIADLLGVPRDTAFMELIAHTEHLMDTVDKSTGKLSPTTPASEAGKPPKKPRPPKQKPPKPPVTPSPPSVPMGGPLIPVQKTAMQKVVDYIESMLLSSEAAALNGLERSMRGMGMPFAHIKKVMLASSTAQAVHAAYLGQQATIQGKLKYNPLTYSWEAEEGTSVNSVKAKTLQIGQQYGLDPKETMDQFQDIMEARRVKEIHEKANDVLSNYETLKQTDRKKAAAYLKANKKIVQLSKRMTALQMTEEEADNILDAAQEEYPEFFDADGPVAMWREVRDNTVQFMVDSGRYSRNQAEALMEAAAYVPFQRVMESEDPAKTIESIHKGIAHSLLGGRKQYGIKGSAREVRNIFQNMEQWQAHSFSIGVKNHKALQLIDATQMYMPEGSVREVKPGTPGAIMVYRHGKKEYYKYADPLFYHAFNGMQGVTTDALRFGSKYASIYQNFIVRNPLFTLAQLPQDTYAAMYTSGLKNPLALPIEVVKQFYKTQRGRETQERKALIKRGIAGDTGFNTIDAHEMNILMGVTPEETGMQKVNKWLAHFSEMGDAAVRQAVYARTMKEMKGLPDAEAIATQRAADIINFRRQGASATSNMIRQVVPFYGAYLQAQRVAIRTLSGRGISPTQRSDALRTLATTTAQTVALGFIYAALAGDDDKFKEMSPQERDNKLLIPGTDFEIPLRRDWTLIPHAIGMHAYTQLFDKGTEDPDTAKRAVRDALLNAAFAIPTPIPAVIKPEVEVALNHDMFTGRDIESQAMDNLDVDKKFLPTTSILGKLAGKTGLISPVNFDHLFKGHTGQLGAGILALTDAALSKAFDIPYTEKSATEIARSVPGVSSLVSKEFHNGDAAKFYNLLNDMTRASTTMSWKEKNAPEEVEAYAKEKGNLLDEGVKGSLNDMRKQLHDINEEERRIGNLPNKEMPPAEKRKAIAELKQYKKETLSSIQEMRNYIYR